VATKGLKRKLSALLSADVKGYSRMMGEDEAATVETITVYREVMATLIQEHRGRVVDSPGDNLLAEFASVVDAVNCAVAIQRELAERNAELPAERKMEFRIGINLGDVIQEGERIYGDGVNVAARIEGLAEGGGVCISGTAYDQIGKKLPLGYEFLGERTVKNIEKPIRVYRVLTEPTFAGMLIGEQRAKLRGWQLAAAVAAILVVGTFVVGLWSFHLRPPPSGEVSPVEKMADSLLGRPSIAVLPFKNLSGDAEQEYFNDGITNDIITDLSKFRQLFVIASNTTSTYKGQPRRVKAVGHDLGVRYVLEGSAQRAGKKVRINAQLIDATTGHHLWAERYERDLMDVFALQDEIVQMIVTKLALKIDEAERIRAMRKDTESLEAYDYVLRGLQHLRHTTRPDNRKARQMFEKAIDLDPRYGSAYVALGSSYYQSASYGWTEFPDQALERAHDLAQKALSLEESNGSAHRLLGEVYVRRTQYDLAASELRRAIELNPNDAHSYTTLGSVMLYSGRTDNAIRSLETALRFDPNRGPGYYMELGLAYYLKRRYQDSLGTLEKGLSRRPDFVGYHMALAAVYAQLGRSENAANAAATVLRLHPFFEVDSYGSVFRNPEDREAIVDGLRKAGLK